MSGCRFDNDYSVGNTDAEVCNMNLSFICKSCKDYYKKIKPGPKKTMTCTEGDDDWLGPQNAICPDMCPEGFTLAGRRTWHGLQSEPEWWDTSVSPKPFPTIYNIYEGKPTHDNDDDDVRCAFHNVCVANDPHTGNQPLDTQLSCCLNQVGKPVGTCGPGWCADGSACGPMMAEHCVFPENYETCKDYLNLTESVANKKKVIQNIMAQNYGEQGEKGVIGNKFNDEAIKLCSGSYATVPDSSIAGTCDPYLQSACKQITDYDTLKNNLTLQQLCGCFLTDNFYKKYYSGAIPYYCTPLCNLPGTVRPAGGSLGGFLECTESLCVFDDITIDIINSQFQGSLNFKQVCPNSGGAGNTACYIDSNDIKILNSQASKGDIDLSQYCSPCVQYTKKPDGSIINQSCPGTCGSHCKKEEDCGATCPNCVSVDNTQKCGVLCGGDCKLEKQCISTDCPACVGGKCQAIPNCVKDKCPDGWICNEKDKKCYIKCVSSPDCDPGYSCRNGMCQSGCITNSDCGIDHICVSGKCQVGCINDDNCAIGLKCIAGLCQKPENGGGGGNGNGNGDENGFWDKYKWYIIGSGIAIIILIPLIYFLIRLWRRKKKN